MPTRFSCDYSKRPAGCKKCKMQIPKGTAPAQLKESAGFHGKPETSVLIQEFGHESPISVVKHSLALSGIELRLAKITPNPFIKEAENPPDMKMYFHPNCLFEMFYKARANTVVIQEQGDIEGWGELETADKNKISELIDDLQKVRSEKAAGATKTPAKRKKSKDEESESPPIKQKATASHSKGKESEKKEKDRKKTDSANADAAKDDVNEESKYNSFYKFCQLCDVIASLPSYKDKSDAVNLFLKKDGFDGDVLTLVRLLLPGIDQRVYNMKEKQILKNVQMAFPDDLDADEMTDHYKHSGDVSVTIKKFVEKSKITKVMKKSDWSIHKVDRWLNKLADFTLDKDLTAHLKFAVKRLSPLETQYLLRLVKKDLRINAGVKHVLEGLHPNAYDAFQSCRDLEDIVKRCMSNDLSDKSGGSSLNVEVKLGMPVLPMLACKSVEQAMKRCPNGMFAEIKYDGERVQVHKEGSNFTYYSRSLKSVQDHKVCQFAEYISQAFANGNDLILDAEVLMVDTLTGKPLPFGTLGVHKKSQFKDAVVGLFIFDILRYNDQNLMNTPLKVRKSMLEKTMVEVPHRIMFSNYRSIKNGENGALKTMIWKAIDEGLEGLVLKDTQSHYEPGKRHWLKVKKDYLEEGSMADTADLLVLGAYFGTGNKGGMMSVFLMGVYDSYTSSYRTVCKCGNGHNDETLKQINKELESKMSRVHTPSEWTPPSWLRCARGLYPDFIIKDPKEAPVWEITGAEFSRSDNHSADGISIRFPRVTKIRDTKDWQSATSLKELSKLYDVSKEKSDISLDRTIADDETPLYAKNETSTAANTSSSEIDNSLARTGKKEAKGEEKEQISKVGDIKKEEKQKDECPADMSPCKYGADCFRKNPEHKKKYWHPKK